MTIFFVIFPIKSDSSRLWFDTDTGSMVRRKPAERPQNSVWHGGWQRWCHAQAEHLQRAMHLSGEDSPIHSPDSRTYCAVTRFV